MITLPKARPVATLALPEAGTVVVALYGGLAETLLATPLLQALRLRYPGARLCALTRADTRRLLEGLPWLDAVHALPPELDDLFSHTSLLLDFWRLSPHFRTVQALKADLALAPTLLRDLVTDAALLASGAPIRIAREGPTDADGPGEAEERRYFCTHLLEPEAPARSHRDRFTAFPGRLGLEAGALPLAFAPGPGARAEADRFLERHGLDPAATLAVYPGSWPRLLGPETFARHLEGALAGRPWKVLLLGSVLDGLGLAGQDAVSGTWVRAFGQLDWAARAALMARLPLNLGYEGEWVHLAGAVGRPHVVLAGGGEEALPSTPATIVACRPLECYGCGWLCRYPSLHCLDALRSQTVAAAVDLALDGAGRGCRGALDRAPREDSGEPALRPGGPEGVHWIEVP